MNCFTKIKSALLFFFLIVFSSCQKLDNKLDGNDETNPILLTTEEIASITDYDPTKITDADIIATLKDFKERIYPDNPATKSLAGEPNFEIEPFALDTPKAKGAASESEEVQIHVPTYKVSIKNGNLQEIAVVAADIRKPTILAYYEVPDTSEYVSDFNSILIGEALNAVKHRIGLSAKLRDSLRQSTLAKLSEKYQVDADNFKFEDYKDRIVLAGQPRVKATRVDDVPPDGPLPYGPWATTELRVFPLISVGWGKGMPYNRLMPQTCPNNWLWDYRIPISSSSVAIAQILSFLGTPINANGTVIDWTYLTENEEILEVGEIFGQNPRPADPIERRNMVASLMKYIGEQCGVTYTCTTATTSTANVISFFQSRNIHIGAYQNFDFDIIQASIQDIEPVMMYGQTSSGQGHWWVVDGFVIQRISWDPSDPNASWWHDKYVHANMGEGRTYKGYYLVGSNMSFNPGFANFTTNIHMMPNIRPN